MLDRYIVSNHIYPFKTGKSCALIICITGKAGFITGLYVIITPIMGLLWRMRPTGAAWAGAVLAVERGQEHDRYRAGGVARAQDPEETDDDCEDQRDTAA